MAAALEPGRLEELTRRISQESTRIANTGQDPVVLCSPSIRLPLRRMLERQLPRLSVLAYTEVAAGVDVTVDGVVGLD